MLSWTKFAQVSLLLAATLVCAPAQPSNQYIVHISRAGNISQLLTNLGGTLVRSLSGSGSGVYIVAVPASLSPSQALAALGSQPGVLNAEPDAATLFPEASPTSSFQPDQVWNVNSLYSYLSTLQTSISTAQLTIANSINVSANTTNGMAMAWQGYTGQPTAQIINLNQAHSFSMGSGTVAFLDTGIDYSHPVLAQSIVPGWDFTTNIPGGSAILDDDSMQSTTGILDDDSTLILDQSTTGLLDDDSMSYQSTTGILDSGKPQSYYGHGTMVAGLIHLVAPNAKLLPVRVFHNDGTASLSAILQGLYWAVDHGANVINMSFSLPAPSAELSNAINYAVSKNVVLVASAGNEGQDILVYPAAVSGVIGVGSTDRLDLRSRFSNYGQVATLAAPGEGVVTTYPHNQYAAGWGTSFSAPLVAGGAALLFDMNGNLNEGKAAQALEQCAPVGQQLGAGRLDLFRACSFEANASHH